MVSVRFASRFRQFELLEYLCASGGEAHAFTRAVDPFGRPCSTSRCRGSRALFWLEARGFGPRPPGTPRVGLLASASPRRSALAVPAAAVPVRGSLLAPWEVRAVHAKGRARACGRPIDNPAHWQLRMAGCMQRRCSFSAATHRQTHQNYPGDGVRAVQSTRPSRLACGRSGVRDPRGHGVGRVVAQGFS